MLRLEFEYRTKRSRSAALRNLETPKPRNPVSVSRFRSPAHPETSQLPDLATPFQNSQPNIGTKLQAIQNRSAPITVLMKFITSLGTSIFRLPRMLSK